MKTADFLRQHDACRGGAKWALSVSLDMADVWDALIEQDKHEWLLWVVTRPGVVSTPTLRRLACRFVRETPLLDGRKVWDLLTDERSRNAIEVAERYADGKATKEELADARNAACNAANVVYDTVDYAAAHAAAHAAAYAAAYISAYAATYAATRAARAAYNAAYAAAGAASYSAHAAAHAAARAAAWAAYDSAYASAYDAYDAHAAAEAAKSAQIKMIAEIGNPFRKGQERAGR